MESEASLLGAAARMEWWNVGMMDWGKSRETESSQREQDGEWIALRNA
jgi:hypothetical protein